MDAAKRIIACVLARCDLARNLFRMISMAEHVAAGPFRSHSMILPTRKQQQQQISTISMNSLNIGGARTFHKYWPRSYRGHKEFH